ncbi:MAG: DUF885 family protein, partial [Chthoniobacterales bacterium]|nr:DUF885 family protein [Chthoniobacterales bacterium]
MKRIYPFAIYVAGALSLASSPFNNPVTTPFPRPSATTTPSATPTATPKPTPKPSRSPKKTSPTPSHRASAAPSAKPAATTPAKPSPSPTATVAVASPPPTASPALNTSDAEFEKVADEYIKGYLTWRPLAATGLGFHEYDGRVNECTRLAIDAELERLRRFDERLKKFEASKLSPREAIDLRLLQTSINRELFQIRDMSSFEQNPMTYARAIDVNAYIKRNFAPLEDRVRSIIAIENQAPNIVIAAKTNLNPVLPKPYVELAIQIARGTADFMKRNLVEALAGLKDEKLVAGFQQSNRKATMALNEYANWLEKERLPKANAPFALGDEKYHRMLKEGELVDLEPAKVLEIGLAELKNEQKVFAEAARKIDVSKPAADIFKQIQTEHPTAENLLPDMAQKLDAIRQFVLDQHLVSIPSDVRAQLKEMPQYRRATSFASMDTPGAFEAKATEAYYYVTPTESDWPDNQKEQWLTSFNFYSGDVISIHETYPGHYVQFLHLNASKASKAEKIFGSYAFIEGWAHYCEKMVVDAGYGSSMTPHPSDEDVKRAAKYRMAQAAEAMKRLCRLCVSIKLHT